VLLERFSASLSHLNSLYILVEFELSLVYIIKLLFLVTVKSSDVIFNVKINKTMIGTIFVLWDTGVEKDIQRGPFHLITKTVEGKV